MTNDVAWLKSGGFKGVTTRTAVISHLYVMIGASVALSQSQHIGVSHYLPVGYAHTAHMCGYAQRATSHTQAKNRDHEIVRSQKKVPKGHPKTPPKSFGVVTDPQVW